jgi:hypothetical protein
MENTFTLANIKKRAKKVKKEKGITHIAALEILARENGFANWMNCQRALKDK